MEYEFLSDVIRKASLRVPELELVAEASARIEKPHVLSPWLVFSSALSVKTSHERELTRICSESERHGREYET